MICSHLFSVDLQERSCKRHRRHQALTPQQRYANIHTDEVACSGQRQRLAIPRILDVKLLKPVAPKP